VEEISKRIVSNEERFFAPYLNPASLLNLTPEIVDRLCNAYPSYIQRKVNEVERWKIGWTLIDDKPDTTKHSTCNKP
jgi:hypothetical protein